MTILNTLKRVAQNLDESYLDVVLSLFGDRPGIRGLLCHAVFNDEEEIVLNHVLPQQGLTIEHYRFLFESFRKLGYSFISSSSLSNGIDSKGKYIYLTFDDGYFNNTRILPLLKEYNVPAHIFVCSKNITNQTKFWWDVIHEKRSSEGLLARDIDAEINSLKRKSDGEIEDYVKDRFGKTSFYPLSEVDRPLTVGELEELAEDPLVTIGSHTDKHSILTNYSKEVARDEIVLGETEVRRILGYCPRTFAFPNGNYTTTHLDILDNIGFTIGLTCNEVINKLPSSLVGTNRLCLGRFCFTAYRPHSWQVKYFRVGHSIIELARRLHSSING